MTRHWAGLAVILTLAVVLSGCYFGKMVTSPVVVNGSGNVISEVRDVGSFSGVELNAVGQVKITQGDQDSLTVTADDNLLPLIKTTVRNGVLVIEFERPAITFNSVKQLEYQITVRSLESLEINGAGDADVSNLSGESLRVKVAGAGNIVVEGKVTSQEVTLTGAGRYDAENLESQRATVDINGAGSATVWATEALDVGINGMGSVGYYGDPQVTKHISGVGSVESKGSK